ncbi:MAG: AmmeMemoRadiSam system protein B [Anaerolineales bacterium]|nr:AmmeMemoRadiSam system protein B [Anaerolineales bacterium]
MKAATDIRPSPIAGRWYPADKELLAESVDEYINSATLPPIEGEVIGVVAPHAGHLYSGPVAGYAFAALCGLKPDVVVIVSPMHYPYQQPFLTSAHLAYQTPLGTVDIDQSLIASINHKLKAELGTELTQVSNDQEHSLEIELPFLQRVLGETFQIAPIMLREHNIRIVRSFGSILARCLRGKNSILVGSTDLSHFYTQEQARIFDTEMLRRMESFDPEKVIRAEEEGKGFACGRSAVAAIMWAASELGANHVQILNYATSGDMTGDYSQVVGYGAAVITRKP